MTYRTSSPGPGGGMRSKLAHSREVSRLWTTLSFLLINFFLRRRTEDSSGSSSPSDCSLESDKQKN
jgi:hypothetical protein